MTDYHPSLTPKELSETISALGVRKANTKPWQLILLGLLAGLYIAFGAQLFLVALEQGMGKVAAGAVFSIGLVFVVIAGAELFTGNIIMTIGAITRKFPARLMLKSWFFVYVGNFVGAILCAWLVWQSGLLTTADGASPNAVGAIASTIAKAKLELSFIQALLRGFLCNIFVLLALLMSLLAKDTISKVICCVLPIMAFVACGYEHCVANMYLIPAGFLAEGEGLSWLGSMWRNIVPVTIGNILGGVFILVIHPNRIRQIRMLWNKTG